MSFDLEAFDTMVSSVSIWAVVLSVVTGVGPGCAWPSSSHVVRSGMAPIRINSQQFGSSWNWSWCKTAEKNSSLLIECNLRVLEIMSWFAIYSEV